MILTTVKFGMLIGQKLSKDVTKMIHDTYDIKYIGDIPQLNALFNELPYILQNIQRMNDSNNNNILGGASRIDEFGNLFFHNGFLEFLTHDSLISYLSDDLVKEYINISHRITNLYTFNEFWYKNPLRYGNYFIAKKNIRSVTDFANFGSSMFQEIKTLINSDKYKEGFIANQLQNYIYYSYAIELINLFNLLHKLPDNNFQRLFNNNTIIEGATTFQNLQKLFLKNENDILVGLDDNNFFAKNLQENGGRSVIESMFFAKKILENDLVKILSEGIGEYFDL